MYMPLFAQTCYFDFVIVYILFHEIFSIYLSGQVRSMRGLCNVFSIIILYKNDIFFLKIK